MTNIYVVDRIEEEIVVLESYDEEIISISKRNISAFIKEGDVLIRKGDKFIFSEEETNKRRESIEQKTMDMWEE